MDDSNEESGKVEEEISSTALAVREPDAVLAPRSKRNGHSKETTPPQKEPEPGTEEAWAHVFFRFGDKDAERNQRSPLVMALMETILVMINQKSEDGLTEAVASGKSLSTIVMDDQKRPYKVSIKLAITAKPVAGFMTGPTKE